MATFNALLLLVCIGASLYVGNITAALFAFSGFIGWMRVAQLKGEFK